MLLCTLAFKSRIQGQPLSLQFDGRAGRLGLGAKKSEESRAVKLHAWYDFFFKVRTQNSKGSVCPVDCVRIELQVCTFDSYLIPLSVRREIQGVGIVSAARAPHQRLSFRRAWNRGARITSRRRGGGSSYRETGSASAARTAADRSAVLGGSDGGSSRRRARASQVAAAAARSLFGSLHPAECQGGKRTTSD